MRLNESLAAASPVLQQGWLARAHLQEASASARLDEIFIDAEDLLLMDHDSLGRLIDQDTQRAFQGLQLLRAVERRHPRQLFTPRRLVAAARLRLRDRKDVEGYPAWLEARRANPDEIRQVLEKALDPAALSPWRERTPLIGAAGFLGIWHRSGAADLLGGATGRALAGAWMRREVPSAPGSFLPAIGFLGHAADWHPSTGPRWAVSVLEASIRGADWGAKLLASLRRAEKRLKAASADDRSHSRLPALLDLLIATPAISARQAAEALAITPMSARRLFDRLATQNLVREITGRGAFRLYAAV